MDQLLPWGLMLENGFGVAGQWQWASQQPLPLPDLGMGESCCVAAHGTILFPLHLVQQEAGSQQIR